MLHLQNKINLWRLSNSFLQRLPWSKLRHFFRLDLDFFSSLRVSALSSGFLDDTEAAETHQADPFPFLQGTGNGADNSVHRFFGFFLGAGYIRDYLNDIRFVYGGSS